MADVRIPDLGGIEGVVVIEILVSEGDRVAPEDALVTLESDKASMDVPSPVGGVVASISVEVGQTVTEGQVVLRLEATGEEPAGDDEPDIGPHAADPPDEPEPSPRPHSSASASAREVELLVLGGGPGGYAAAFRAADLGREVLLVERSPVLGGVCLNVGCIPSKALLHAARVIHETREMAERGLRFGAPEIDLDKLRAWKSSVVDRLTGGLDGLADRRKVERRTGTGRFVSPRELEIETDAGVERIGFRQAIVAVGSRPIVLPGIPQDDPRIWDSTDALELPEIPPRLLVIGGGIIGLEMATVYAALGSQVTVVELTDGLIPGADRDLVRPLHRRLTDALGIGIRVGTRVEEVTPGPPLVARLAGGEGEDRLEVDRVLVAVGRRPNGDRIGAGAAGLPTDARGFLAVDHQMRTAVPHIFAIGDVVGQPMLAHKATHQGKVAAEVASGEKRAFDARVIPSVAYTDPEVAWVGPTEREAKEQGLVLEKAVFPWAASGRALGMGRSEGLTKLLFEPRSGRVVSGGVVGPNAGDLAGEIALAIEMQCDAADIGLTIHPHPTLSETVGLAAELFDGTITDLLPPRRRH